MKAIALFALFLLSTVPTVESATGLKTCSMGCQCSDSGTAVTQFLGYQCSMVTKDIVPGEDDGNDLLQKSSIKPFVYSVWAAAVAAKQSELWKKGNTAYNIYTSVNMAANIVKRLLSRTEEYAEDAFVGVIKLSSPTGTQKKKFSGTTKPLTYYSPKLAEIASMNWDDRNSIRIRLNEPKWVLHMTCVSVNRKGDQSSSFHYGNEIIISHNRNPSDTEKFRYQCDWAVAAFEAPGACLKDCKLINTCQFAMSPYAGRIAWRTGKSGNDNAWDSDNAEFVGYVRQDILDLNLVTMVYNNAISIYELYLELFQGATTPRPRSNGVIRTITVGNDTFEVTRELPEVRSDLFGPSFGIKDLLRNATH